MESLIYQIVVVFMARRDARLILRDRPVSHFLNGLTHLLAAVIVLPTGIVNSVSLLLLTRVVFDSSLNLFRGLSIGYVSPRPSSFVDRMEVRLFGRNGYLPKLVYLTILLVINIVLC